MEKEGLASIPFLPLLYQFRQRRMQSPLYAYFVFAIEAIFVAIFPFNHSQNVADPAMTVAVQIYQGFVVQDAIIMYTITILFLMVPLLTLISVAAVYLQTRCEDKQKHWSKLEQVKKVCIVVLIALEPVILPAFLMSAQNIVNDVVDQLTPISIINMPFAILLVLLEKQRRFYHAFSVPIVLSRMFLPDSWLPAATTIISLWLGSTEKKLYKRVVYYQMGFWCAMIFVSNFLNVTLSSFHLLLGIIAIAVLTALSPEDQEQSLLEENERLMKLTEKVMEGKQLCLQERMTVSRAVFRFREQLLAAEKHHLTTNEAQWIQGEWALSPQQLQSFLTTKISFQLRRQYSHELKIQQLKCQVRLGRIGMRTLFQLQILIQQVRQESTFQQREKLYELVSFADQRFQRKEHSIDVTATISHQREVQLLYELIINIAILMQQFWVLHQGGRLSSAIMCRVLKRVEEMETSAERVLRSSSRSGNTRHQQLILDYLRKLVNNSHRPRDQQLQQPLGEKEDLLAGQHRNYILIEQGNILAMSNRLLNEFQLSRKEAEGYRIGDIVNEQTAEFLRGRLDRLIEEEGKEGGFLLPLKVSRQKPYIQPYRAEVQILPELMNGIKYMLQLQKPPQLTCTPYLLYSASRDRLLGITRNFATYFALPHDHYLTQNFTHELFSVDVLSLLQSAAREQNEIICEFKAHRTASKGVITNIPVVLRKVKEYPLKTETIALLSIIKREQLQRTQLTNLASEKIPFLDQTRQDTRERQATNTRTFCKISNPYENLIDQKISKMGESYRMSYLKGVMLMGLGLISVLVTALIALQIQLGTVTGSLMDNYHKSVVDNDKTINTMQLFTHSSIYYQIMHYPQQFLTANANPNFTSLINEYIGKIDVDIRTVLQEDIASQIHIYDSVMEAVSLYDVLADAKLAITTLDVAPLIQDWPAIRVAALGHSRPSQSAIAALEKFFWVLSLVSGALAVGLVVGTVLASWRVQWVSDELLSIYQKIDPQHSLQFVKRFRTFAHELYSSSYFRGVRAHEYLRNYKKKSALDDIDELSTLMYLEKAVGIDLQQDQPIPSEGEAASNDQVGVGKKHCLAFLWRQSYMALIGISFVSFLCIILYFVSDFQANFSSVVNHSIRLHEVRGNISYNSAYFMTASLQQVLPAAKRTPASNATRMTLTSQLTTSLPPFYDAYVASETQMLYSDLCSLGLTNNSSVYKDMQCDSVLGGIMKMGFPQTVIFYNDLVNRYSFAPMSTFGSLFRSNSKYPVFLQVLYVRRALYTLVTELENTFQQQTQQYAREQSAGIETAIKTGWILLPLFLGLLIVFFLQVHSKCAIALKSFFILPKEYLLEMKVTKVLRQRDILSHIEKLAF